MQIFNIITNIFTIISAIIGCFMFYFTFKNHKWLVEDRKKQIEEDVIKKINVIFSYVAECMLSNKINKIFLQTNIVNDISSYNIPRGIVDFINEDIKKEIHNEHILQTHNYKNIVLQIIHQYRNGIRLHEANFNKLRSFFKNNEEIDNIYSDISKSNEIL